MQRPFGLSKSRFTAGLQCRRLLWWRVNDMGAPELVPDARQQAIFDQGTRVGELARTHVPGGTLADEGLEWSDFAAKIAATRAAIDAGAPAIYEASFLADHVFVAVDILARDGDGWRLIEVKSSTTVKDQHLPDAAVQVHVVRRAGLDVTGAEVMVLNRECRHPHLENLFTRHDVTARIAPWLERAPALVDEMIAVLQGPLPDVAPGWHCDTPYRCPFHARCNPAPEAAAPVASGEPVLARAGLAGALARFKGPLAYLDFETVMPAIPVWNGCRPYETVPVQFSVQAELDDGTLAHHAWLAEGADDPRPELARRVVEACAGAVSVIAYNASFERQCLEHLAAAVPAHATALRDIVRRLADPYPVVRNHVAHPALGTCGLKQVLPVLAPGLSYDDLAIADGETASLALTRLVFARDAMPDAERAALREALLAYCERDTLALVRVMARLRGLAGGDGA